MRLSIRRAYFLSFALFLLASAFLLFLCFRPHSVKEGASEFVLATQASDRIQTSHHVTKELITESGTSVLLRAQRAELNLTLDHHFHEIFHQLILTSVPYTCFAPAGCFDYTDKTLTIETPTYHFEHNGVELEGHSGTGIADFRKTGGFFEAPSFSAMGATLAVQGTKIRFFFNTYACFIENIDGHWQGNHFAAAEGVCRLKEAILFLKGNPKIEGPWGTLATEEDISLTTNPSRQWLDTLACSGKTILTTKAAVFTSDGGVDYASQSHKIISRPSTKKVHYQTAEHDIVADRATFTLTGDVFTASLFEGHVVLKTDTHTIYAERALFHAEHPECILTGSLLCIDQKDASTFTAEEVWIKKDYIKVIGALHGIKS